MMNIVECLKYVIDRCIARMYPNNPEMRDEYYKRLDFWRDLNFEIVSRYWHGWINFCENEGHAQCKIYFLEEMMGFDEYKYPLILALQYCWVYFGRARTDEWVDLIRTQWMIKEQKIDENAKPIISVGGFIL